MGKTRFKKDFQKQRFRTPRWKIGKHFAQKIRSLFQNKSSPNPRQDIPPDSRPKNPVKD